MELKSVNRVETNKSELTVQVSPEEFEQAIGQIYPRESKRLMVPGFRKGKAPRKVLEKYYGEEVFFEPAINHIYRDIVNFGLEESKLDVVAVGKVDVTQVSKAEGVTLTLEVVTKPEVSLEGYKGLEIHKEPVVVTEGEIDQEIERVRERNSRTVTVEDRPAQNGDIVDIDYQGLLDGLPFDGGTAENFELTLGSGQFIPGFESQVEGHSAGEEFDINVTFPEDYHAEELKGKPVVFKIKLHEIKSKELPEVDDEFVKDVSEFDTVAEYREDLKKSMLERRERAADEDVDNQLAEAVVEKMQAEIPDEMVENETDELINNFSYQLQSQGLKLETYLKYTGMGTEELRAQFAERAGHQVKMRLALEKIAALEGIEPTEEEMEEEFKRLGEQYGMPAENVKNLIRVDDLKMDLKCKKAVDFLRENAKIIEAVKEGEEEKPAKKPAAKKAPAKKAAPKDEAAEEDKPAPKKRTAKKKEEPQEEKAGE